MLTAIIVILIVIGMFTKSKKPGTWFGVWLGLSVVVFGIGKLTGSLP